MSSKPLSLYSRIMDNNCDSPKESALEQAVTLARRGDRGSLETVVLSIEKDVYTLALRFLWHPQDAEDATQEILVRVITSLSSFRGESAFKTWVYRIASNTLLTLQRKRMERDTISFEEFGKDLSEGLSGSPYSGDPDAQRALLLEEVKIGCTLDMLLCLDREHRLAYILGEIMELDHTEASQVMGSTKANFRKRLSRARKSVNEFTHAKCGLVNPENACRCAKRVDTAVKLGRVDPSHLMFASSSEIAGRFPEVLSHIRAIDHILRAAELYRSHSMPEPSGGFKEWLKKLLADGGFADRDSDNYKS